MFFFENNIVTLAKELRNRYNKKKRLKTRNYRTLRHRQTL